MKKRGSPQSKAVALFVARMQEAPAGTEEEIVLPEGGRMVARRNPAPGVHLVAETIDAPNWSRHEVFEPAESPVESYPTDLPFLPCVRTTVMRHSGAGGPAMLAVAWSGVVRPRSVARALVEQSMREGWAVVGTFGVWPLIPPITSLRRDGENRSISAVRRPRGTVMLQSVSVRAP